MSRETEKQGGRSSRGRSSSFAWVESSDSNAGTTSESQGNYSHDSAGSEDTWISSESNRSEDSPEPVEPSGESHGHTEMAIRRPRSWMERTSKNFRKKRPYNIEKVYNDPGQSSHHHDQDLSDSVFHTEVIGWLAARSASQSAISVSTASMMSDSSFYDDRWDPNSPKNQQEDMKKEEGPEQRQR